MQPLSTRTLRASAAFELVLFDRLPASEQHALAALRRSADLYGVLRPRDVVVGTIKAVSRETALLLLTLREPGLLPAYVGVDANAAAARDVVRLILDGVLEIEENGRFLSGPAALGVLGHERGERPATAGIAALSRAAVAHAARIDVADPMALASRLYSFNRRPLTPTLARQAPTATAARAFLDINRDTTTTSRLARSWGKADVDPGEEWLLWAPKWRRRVGAGEAPVTYKVYVSPTIEALQQTFNTTVAVLADAGAPVFKVAAHAGAFIRPDKLVVYFRSEQTARETAALLKDALGETPAQPVPFTAQLDDTGLLSWGIDPPYDEIPLPAAPRSWRLWICRRLGAYLSLAKQQRSERPAHFALERLRLEGVDVDTWTPNAAVAFAAEGAS